MKEKDLQLAKKFKDLVAKKVPLREVKVFGSRAKGKAVSESDLDILVAVAHLDYETERYISECAWEAGFPEDVVIVPVVVEQHALESGPLSESSFIRTVQKDGINI